VCGGGLDCAGYTSISYIPFFKGDVLEVFMKKKTTIGLAILAMLVVGIMFLGCMQDEEPEIGTPSGLFVERNSYSAKILKIGWTVSYRGSDLAEKYSVEYRDAESGYWTFAGYTNGVNNRFTFDDTHDDGNGYSYYWFSSGDRVEFRVRAWYGGHAGGYSSAMVVTIQ
jgi:hypothetical protein